MHSASPSRTHRAWIASATIAGALLFGVLEAWQGRFVYPHIPPALFWPEALARSMPSWITLAALIPGIVFVARRFPFDRGHAWRASVVHVLAAILFVFLHLGASSVLISWRHGGDPSISVAMLRMLSRWAVMDLFTFWALAGAVHVARYGAESRAREVTEAELRARLSEARLQTLRAQLNPHFLFNALNSISTLAMTGDRETLQRAVAALADLLRVVLREGSGVSTSLESELDTLGYYLDLQRLRFGSRLSVVRHVDPETLRASVPSLVLQPLAENAVQHGVGTHRGDGSVTIVARRRDDRLVLEVRDTGPGFPADVIEGRRRGIGLTNTRLRLEQMYGTDFWMDCRNAPEGGAVLTLDIPWREDHSVAIATPISGGGS